MCLCVCVCVFAGGAMPRVPGPPGPPPLGTPESGARLEFCSPDITPGLQIKAYYGQLAESLQVRLLYRQDITRSNACHLLVALTQSALCSTAGIMGGPGGNQSHISVRVTVGLFLLNHLNDICMCMWLVGRLGGN